MSEATTAQSEVFRQALDDFGAEFDRHASRLRGAALGAELDEEDVRETMTLCNDAGLAIMRAHDAGLLRWLDPSLLDRHHRFLSWSDSISLLDALKPDDIDDLPVPPSECPLTMFQELSGARRFTDSMDGIGVTVRNPHRCLAERAVFKSLDLKLTADGTSRKRRHVMALERFRDVCLRVASSILPSVHPVTEKDDAVDADPLVIDQTRPEDSIRAVAAARMLMKVVDGLDLPKAKARVSSAARRGEFVTNGLKGPDGRIDLHTLNTWLMKHRKKNLDKADS